MNSWARASLVVLAALIAVLAGCSGEEQEPGADVPEGGDQSGTAVVDDGRSTPSPEARSRGVATIEADDEDGLQPLVVLQDIVYEWRVSPERGLHVTLGFINPNDTYERARGYVFIVASSRASSGAVYGVYPWDIDLGEDGLPVDYMDGMHLLYRRDQEIRASIPYRNASGYYDVLRILVYSEDGDVLIDNTVDLEVSGEPTGAVRPPVDLTL